MDWRAAMLRGTWAGWPVRGALAVLVAAGCYGSVTFSLAQRLATANPALAYRLAPYDGRIAARYAASLLGPEASVTDRRRADGLARVALRRDPTAVMAVSTLGINAAARGDAAAARRFFDYTQMLSRRDLQSQLWGIEDAVQRGDIAGSLHHYDVVLRVWPRMSDILFPVLAGASGEQQVRAVLVRLLASRPRWMAGFVEFVARYEADPSSGARLLTELGRRGIPISDQAQAAMVASLIARGGPDAAWAYYAALHPRADRRGVRDPRFAARSATPSPLDWVPVDENGIVASIDGALEFSVPPSVAGPLVRQIQLLPPGRYVLTSYGSGVGDASAPYWSLTCQGGRQIGQLPLPAATQATGKVAMPLVVPGDCLIQTLALVARPTDALTGLTGRVDRVELRPAS